MVRLEKTLVPAFPIPVKHKGFRGRRLDRICSSTKDIIAIPGAPSASNMSERSKLYVARIQCLLAFEELVRKDPSDEGLGKLRFESEQKVEETLQDYAGVPKGLLRARIDRKKNIAVLSGDPSDGVYKDAAEEAVRRLETLRIK